MSNENTNMIVVDLNSPKRPINSMIYSNFIEQLGDCIHNGVWIDNPVDINVPLNKDDPFLFGIREDVLKAVKEMKVSVLRAFGGCYSDVYHWKDAIGPKAQRKIVKNKQWARFPMNLIKGLGPKINNQFGTDEFCHFCEAIGAEPYLNVNYSSGSPEEAASWVEYCNGSLNTEYGALRAKNGREKPYDVKFWGIANEIWGIQEIKHEKNPEDYAKRYLLFAKAMREKDPKIKLILVGWFKSYWNQTLLKLIGEEYIDFLSIHQYVPLPFLELLNARSKKHKQKEWSYYSLMTSSRLIEQDIVNTWNDIETVLRKDTHVRISFDEWGVWYKLRDLINTNFNLQDGLCAADILLTFQRYSEVAMANWAQLINCVGTIQTDKEGILLTPVYLAIKMLTNHSQNNIIEGVKVECNTFNAEKWGQIKETNHVPYLTCNVTINDKGDILSVIIINKHFTEKINAKLILNNFNPKEQGSLVELNSESPFDYNTKEERNKIQIKENQITTVNSTLNLELKPHSLSILKLSKK